MGPRATTRPVHPPTELRAEQLCVVARSPCTRAIGFQEDTRSWLPVFPLLLFFLSLENADKCRFDVANVRTNDQDSGCATGLLDRRRQADSCVSDRRRGKDHVQLALTPDIPRVLLVAEVLSCRIPGGVPLVPVAPRRRSNDPAGVCLLLRLQENHLYNFKWIEMQDALQQALLGVVTW